ncbi:MAG: hypothetical protein IJI37_01540, partial [Opitutales bacterium]|nr:hypothetical protein [Opitutales bacterium]
TKQKFDVMYDYDKLIDKNRKELIEDCEKLEQRYKIKPSPRLKNYLERTKRSLEIWDSLKSGDYNSEKASFWYVYRIYVHYNGAFGFEKDLKKVRDCIFMSRDWIWLNFYTGFNVPRDEELAKHILRIQNTEQSRKFLKEIEETGKVNIPREFGFL